MVRRKTPLTGALRLSLLLTILGCALPSLAEPTLPREAEEVRTRLANARKALDTHKGMLGTKQRETLERRLQKSEAAFQEYAQMLRQHENQDSKRAVAAAPLLAAGAIVIADDASVVGVADDVLLPFIGIALLVTQLKAQAPPSRGELEAAWGKVLHELEALGNEATQINKALGYVPPPKTLTAFPNAHETKPKGQGKLRKRWVDEENGWILEWDYQHGKVEKYDKRGRHLGEFDAQTGERTKPADPSRTIEI